MLESALVFVTQIQERKDYQLSEVLEKASLENYTKDYLMRIGLQGYLVMWSEW